MDRTVTPQKIDRSGHRDRKIKRPKVNLIPKLVPVPWTPHAKAVNSSFKYFVFKQ